MPAILCDHMQQPWTCLLLQLGPLGNSLWDMSLMVYCLTLQGSLPSRMSREGAARTYHMYIYWGYFNRRMAVRRQMEQKAMPGFDRQTGIAFGDNSKQQKSYYGEMTNVWRYFENVPDAISDLRTSEAVAVADRHLRYPA